MTRALLVWTIWPLSILAMLAALLYFADVHDPQSLSATFTPITVVLVLGALGLELVLPFRGDWKVKGDHDVWRDLGHLVLYSIVGGNLAGLIYLIGFGSLIAPLNLSRIWPSESPLLVQVLIVLLLADFLEYWLHRLSHRIPALWRVHAIHHMPTRLHMLKAARHHIGYYLLRGVIVWVPLMLIGVPPQLLVWQFIGIVLVQNLSHANIDVRVPAFANRILVTPQVHRVHHSLDAKQGNSNFGVLSPVWDLLFGTYTDPAEVEVSATGIEGDPIPHRFVTELLWPVGAKRT